MSRRLDAADTVDAHLAGANLAYAGGIPWSGMPAGWALDDTGLWVKA